MREFESPISPVISSPPVGYLVAELFELHDRSRFEVIGVSHGPDDQGAERDRIMKSVDRFHDVRNLPDASTARLLRDAEVDIAIDLSGLTKDCRPKSLLIAPRPFR